MLNYLWIIVCSLILLSACNTSTREACESQKDSLELIMNIPMKIKPEYVAAYKVAFEKCKAGTLKEKDCRDYMMLQSYTDSTEFHIYERWINKPGHLHHMQTEHFKQYIDATKVMYDQAKYETIVRYICPKVNS